MTTPTKVEIEVDARGFGRIVVDGVDLSQRIVGFTLRARVGELTRLRLEYVDVEASAAAQVCVP